MRFLPLILMCLLSGCGGCGKLSPKEFYTDADVIALVKAAQRDDIDEIDRLVDKGVDVNAKGKDDFTPLLFALQAKNKPGFLRLLERGADPNIQNDRGQSVMSFVALAKDDSEWLEMVLKHKGNPNLVRASDDIVVGRQTPIFNAIRSQNTRNVELLIKAGAHLNHQGKSGDTPVMYAALSKRYQAAFLLLQAGADWKAQDKDGHDLAFLCMMETVDQDSFPELYQQRQKVVDFLRKKGVDLDAAKNAADKHMGRE